MGKERQKESTLNCGKKKTGCGNAARGHASQGEVKNCGEKLEKKSS